ncbi:MAG: winged helix-turn-helix transcriptional regulator, partial [Oscillibacter sp.]|nr:winged helix-turn-helix transcriptional regulator [Oscillibacter sp.]
LNRDVVLTKENILLKIWGYESGDENSVEVYISFLRRKLSHLRSGVRIRKIRMAGYCLEKE